MYIRIIGLLLTTLILYFSIAKMAVNETEKVFIKVNKPIKYLFGFFIHLGYKFGLKSIVLQIGNILAFTLFFIILIFSKDIAIATLYWRNLIISTIAVTFIISIFVNKWR